MQLLKNSKKSIFGSMRVLVAQINPTIGDLKGNIQKILHGIELGKKEGCSLVITPELAVTGYPPEDLLLLKEFVERAEKSLERLIQATENICLIVGTIRKSGENALYNTAAICYDRKLLGFQDKTLLPTYDVFNERRFFEPAKKNQPWQIGNWTLGVTICEDMWFDQISPLADLATGKLDLAVNLSSSPFFIGKVTLRNEVIQRAAKKLKCPFIFCNQVGGNDSLIFDGHSVLMSPEGKLQEIAKGFQEDYMVMDTSLDQLSSFHQSPTHELHQALILGLKDYFQKQGFKQACLGISGGIDSALVACLAVEALGKENVFGVVMPSRYSSEESMIDAQELVQNLDISSITIPIESPFNGFLELLAPHFHHRPTDTTEENLQARIRGMILMALSNKHGYIVLSTGNKSELALGYCTLYGDLCGGLAVISDVTKSQVYSLCHHINLEHHWIPERILTKAPSAELKPNQKDSDTLPEYPIIDAVLKAYIELGESPEEIAKNTNIDPAIIDDLIKKIHKNEYKRRQSPPGLKVTEKAFTVGRHFPIVHKFNF